MSSPFPSRVRRGKTEKDRQQGICPRRSGVTPLSVLRFFNTWETGGLPKKKNDRAGDRLELFAGHIAQDHVPRSRAQKAKGSRAEQLPPVRSASRTSTANTSPNRSIGRRTPTDMREGTGHEHHHQDAAARNSCLGYSYARACSEHDKPPPYKGRSSPVNEERKSMSQRLSNIVCKF